MPAPGNNFPYHENVPSGPDDPADDQPKMLVNTQSINSWTDVDHVGYDTLGGGIHKKITLNNIPNPVVANTDGTGILFSKLAQGQSFPFWINALGPYQLVGLSTFSANGFATLPGGLIVNWGYQAGLPSAQTFTSAFPTNLFSIQITTLGNSSAQNMVSITSQSTSGFTYTVKNLAGTFTGVYWIAIGN